MLKGSVAAKAVAVDREEDRMMYIDSDGKEVGAPASTDSLNSPAAKSTPCDSADLTQLLCKCRNFATRDDVVVSYDSFVWMT